MKKLIRILSFYSIALRLLQKKLLSFTIIDGKLNCFFMDQIASFIFSDTRVSVVYA